MLRLQCSWTCAPGDREVREEILPYCSLREKKTRKDRNKQQSRSVQKKTLALSEHCIME